MAAEGATSIVLLDEDRGRQMISDAFHARGEPLGLLIADLKNNVNIALESVATVNTKTE